MKDSKPLYFLALLPPGNIQEEITGFKRHLESDFNSKAALRSPPHITLHMPFRQKQSREQAMTEAFHAFAGPQQSFEIKLDGFAAFPPRVIFVDVINNPQLNHLQRAVKDLAKTKLGVFNAEYKDQGYHPHITIGFRDLRKSMFREAWKIYESKSYSRTFEAISLTLLKHNGQYWEVFQEFPFSSETPEID